MSVYDVIHSFYVIGSCGVPHFFQNGSAFRLLYQIFLSVIPAKAGIQIFPKLGRPALSSSKNGRLRFTWIRNLFFEHIYCCSWQQEEGGAMDGGLITMIMRSSQQPYKNV